MSTSVDKNQAVIDFLITCPAIRDGPLYFNFINASDNNKQIVTVSNDVALNKNYIDGSQLRRYVFTLIDFKSVTDNALVMLTNYPNENVIDMSDVQAIIDWIQTQEDEQNYPNFGEDCTVQKISTTTDTPKLDGINVEVTPALAMYSLTVQIDYIDTSKKIWR